MSAAATALLAFQTAPSPGTSPSAAAIPQAPEASASPIAYTYTFTPEKQNATPQIVQVEINNERLRPHGFFAIRVLTSPDVVKVTTGSGKREGALPMIAPGEFAAQSTLPGAPDIVRVRIKLLVTATNAAGETTSVQVPVIFG